MSGEEIKKKIEFNNSQLELIEKSIMTKFILNPKVAALIAENKSLQDACQHSFNEKGVCIYCGWEEVNED